MADNIRLDGPGSGGALVATDEDGSSQHHQYVKVEFGGSDVQTKVTSSVGLPVNNLQNDGVDIGDVDVTSVVPGTAATNLGKAIDNVAGSTDTGVAALAVRNDTLANLTGADGDYAPLQVNADGGLYVSNAASSKVDSSNSSTTNLLTATSLTFPGAYVDVSMYDGITVLVDGTASGTVGGTLTMNFSHDGVTDHRTITAVSTDITAVLPRTLGVVAQYFKITFTADADLTSFTCQTMFHVNQVELVSRLNQTLQGDDDVSNVRAALVALTPSGAYTNVEANDFGALEVEPEQHVVLDTMDALETWAAIDTDTDTVAATTKHVLGSGAISFNKANSVANSGIGGIERTITSVNLGSPSPHDIIQTVVRVSSVADLDNGTANFFVRLGTSSSHYAQWSILGTEFQGGKWETVAIKVGNQDDIGVQVGDGVDWSAVTYVAVGFNFNAENNTLTGIHVDEISFHSNLHVSAAINAEITSTVTSSNVNLQKIGGSATSKGSGVVGNGTQRVTLATDDPAVTALEIIDNIVHVEDVAHGGGDSGIMPLAVRNDDLATLASQDGDYTPLQVTQNGALLMCPAANDDYKYAVIDDATSGNNTIVALVASRKIRVLALYMVATGTVNARFESNAAGTALTGVVPLIANSGFVLPFNPAGWFETVAGELLNLELSAAISVDGSLTYIEVP